MCKQLAYTDYNTLSFPMSAHRSSKSADVRLHDPQLPVADTRRLVYSTTLIMSWETTRRGGTRSALPDVWSLSLITVIFL